MKILVDTSVWSMALRRHATGGNLAVSRILNEIIANMQLVIMGPIRQEILSGIRHEAQFIKLQTHLRPFPDLQLPTAVYELAASYHNRCRQAGVQGSHVDFLICAAAVHFDLQIYTLDKDFTLYQAHLPLRLLQQPQ